MADRGEETGVRVPLHRGRGEAAFMQTPNGLHRSGFGPHATLLSQVLYAIKEYACTAIDVIARRTRLGFLNVQAADEALPRIVQIMGKELDWSQERSTVRSQRTCSDLLLTSGY